MRRHVTTSNGEQVEKVQESIFERTFWFDLFKYIAQFKGDNNQNFNSFSDKWLKHEVYH